MLTGVIAPLPRRLLAALLLVAVVRTPAHEGGLGVFSEHTDIGAPKRTADGAVLEFTMDGRRQRVALVAGDQPEAVGAATRYQAGQKI